MHGDGYDVWRERGSFAVGASGGSPPDVVFPKGQDWGFPPLHPEGIRADGYRYVRAYLRHQVQYAGVLRIDHVPMFHRLFWVPAGMDATQGVYVRYPSEELYALFSLESHRARTLLVGEDLGTIPSEVPESMKRHGVGRMYVIQYAAPPDPQQALPAPPFGSVASVNTHDMPPLAAFTAGEDISVRAALGLLGGQDPASEQASRRALVDGLRTFLGPSDDDAVLLESCLLFLARSDARLVLVNLEDLWRETEAQNVPSTAHEHPNWQRRAALSFEQFRDDLRVRQLLAAVDRARRSGETLLRPPLPSERSGNNFSISGAS